MIYIYIYENDPELRSEIEEEINKYIEEKKYQMKIKLSTSNFIQLLGIVQSLTKRGLYFIDTDFEQELQGELIDGLQSAIGKGILLGKEIRKRDTRGFIVYITSNKTLILQTLNHHIEVMDYIMKDGAGKTDIYESLRKCLDTAAQRMEDEFISKMSLIYHSGDK